MITVLQHSIELARGAASAAVRTWPDAAQKAMAVEEMGELIVALHHEARGRAKADDVREEIADVLIMALQLLELYGEEKVLAVLNRKVDRLWHRINQARRESLPTASAP